MNRLLRRLAAALLATCVPSAAYAEADAAGADIAEALAADRAVGERLYREGRRADGRPLVAERLQGLSVRGAEAACIACHRPSGMGGAEGSQAVPPVAGDLLRAPGRAAPLARAPRLAPGLQRQLSAAATRPGYTPALFERALTQGLGAGGQPLDPLMPRYQVSADEAGQLLAYLDTLAAPTPPTAAELVLHLATVVSSDLPEPLRCESADLLGDCLSERSPPAASASPEHPTWRLHRWTLGPDPARWGEELAEWQRREPAFAVISGLTGPDGHGAWQPVHRFCEAESLPCVLPLTASVDDALPGRWSVYFSRGVSLEASGAAEWLAEQAPPGGWRRVHQIVAPQDEAAATGAAALRRRVNAGIELRDHPADEAPDRQAAWLAALDARDALVLWLGPAELRRLATQPVPGAGALLLSGEQLALQAEALGPAWRSKAVVLSATEPAERALPRLARNAGRWLHQSGHALAETPEGLLRQAHSYSACEVTAHALRRLGGRLSRAWFMELVESADEAAVATAFPRFTLGPGQRHGAQGLGLWRYAQGTAHLRPAGEPLAPP